MRGEIANLQRPGSGHVYFDLVGDGCRLRVTLWESDKRVVNAVLRRAGGAVRMSDGTQVRIRARVQWWAEGGQASLRMLSIDTGTRSAAWPKRELLVQRLRAEGVLRQPRALALAARAAAGGSHHQRGQRGRSRLPAHARGQRPCVAGGAGRRARPGRRGRGIGRRGSCTLRRVEPPLDVICIVRGGGARTDLAAFDSEAIARPSPAAPSRCSPASATRSTPRSPTSWRTRGTRRRPRARPRSSPSSPRGASDSTARGPRSPVPRRERSTARARASSAHRRRLGQPPPPAGAGGGPRQPRATAGGPAVTAARRRVTDARQHRGAGAWARSGAGAGPRLVDHRATMDASSAPSPTPRQARHSSRRWPTASCGARSMAESPTSVDPDLVNLGYAHAMEELEAIPR